MFAIKQYHYGKRTLKVGVFLGGLQYQMGAVSSYMGYINIAMSSGTFYIVAHNYISWLSINTYVALLLSLFVFVMVIDWVFIQPGRQGYANQQAAIHDNPLMKEVFSMQSKIDNLNLDIKLIKGALNIEQTNNSDNRSNK